MYQYIFFTNVIRVMREQGLSLRKLAAKSGMSETYIASITKGNANPSIEKMEDIADALRTPLLVLLSATDLSLKELSRATDGALSESLPGNFVHINAILTKSQAFRVKKWDESNRAALSRHI